jgi:hypothetical protein
VKEVRCEIESIGDWGVYLDLEKEDLGLIKKTQQAGLKVRLLIPEVPEVPPKFEWRDGRALYCDGMFCGSITIKQAGSSGITYIDATVDYGWILGHGIKLETNTKVFTCNPYDPTEYTQKLAEAKHNLRSRVEGSLKNEKHKKEEEDKFCLNCCHYRTWDGGWCETGRKPQNYKTERCGLFYKKND